jgi:hypothetical protein
MVFYVYFDPAVITAAEKGGDFALQCLIGVLRGFEANCLLAEFDDYFVQEALKERLNDLQDDNARKDLKSLFATLGKRNRFAYCLESVGASIQLRVADAILQGKRAELDLVLADNPAPHPNPHGIPVCTLLAYNTSSFEQERGAVANGGRTFAAGVRAELAFLDWTLRKALKYSTTITIYDRLFGQKFGGNFEYSAKTLLSWLETFVDDPSQINLHIHCGKPVGNTDHFIQTRLASFRHGRLAAMPITIQFYGGLPGVEVLPHQRYLITHQVAIDLGRGLDFLDPQTHQNRSGKFSFARTDELATALKAVSPSTFSPITF